MMPMSFGYIAVPFGPGYGRSSFISSTLTWAGLISCIDMLLVERVYERVTNSPGYSTAE